MAYIERRSPDSGKKKPFNKRDSSGPGGRERGPRKFPRTMKSSAKFEIPKDVQIEYKNVPLLSRYLTDRGKIVPRRISGITAHEQRKLSSSIKLARFLALLPSGSVKIRFS